MAVLASLPIELFRSMSRLRQSKYTVEKTTPLFRTQLSEHFERDQPLSMECSPLSSHSYFHNLPLEGIPLLRGSEAGVLPSSAYQFLLRTLDRRNVSRNRLTPLHQPLSPPRRLLLLHEPNLHP